MLLLRNVQLDYVKTNIFITNGKITKIGKANEKELKKIFNNIEIIDCGNKYAIPGYIDNHVHVTGGGGEKGFSSKVPEIKISDIISSGVTTVVGVLGTDTITRSVENLVSKTKALNEEGITAYCLTGGYEFPSPTLTGSVQKDIAFINEVIGVKIAISDHRCYNPLKEDLIKLMSEVRVASLISGKKCSVNYHIGWGKGSMNQLLDILHETNIPADLIRPTHITCTDTVFEQAIEMANKGSYVDITAGENVEKSITYIIKAFEKGISDMLTVSSDGNGSVPIWQDGKCIGMNAHSQIGLHRIVKELVKTHNYKLQDAIKILTVNPSNALALTQKGEIKEGKDADILLLDNNFEVDSVIAMGKIFMLNKSIIRKGMYE